MRNDEDLQLLFADAVNSAVRGGLNLLSEEVLWRTDSEGATLISLKVSPGSYPRLAGAYIVSYLRTEGVRVTASHRKLWITFRVAQGRHLAVRKTASPEDVDHLSPQNRLPETTRS